MTPWKIKSFSEEYASAKAPEDHFQRFVADLFVADYPGLGVYQTNGRDGGIDLFQPLHGVVFECKFISERGWKAALKSWKKTRNNFDKHLTSHGPGQTQYDRWYSAEPSISAYLLCVSNEFENESQRQELESEIRTFFVELSARSPSLSHLAKLRVEVWCWDRLAPKLLARPELLLRWYPSLKPLGFDLLDPQEPLKNNFRDYLNPLRLPFLPSPELSVESLLEMTDSQHTGLVLHGHGGIGKTRLMREIGLYALSQDWAVFSINPRFQFKTEGITHLMQQASGARILLLLDYLERFQGFEELHALIEEFNAQNAHIRLLVTCRESFFSQSNSDMLSELGEQGLDGIPFDTIVSHILQPVPNAVKLQAICGNIPIFAVFVRYLYDRNQTDSLHDLLFDGDFKHWWSKRLPTCAKNNPGGNATAASRLFAAYPCNDLVLDALSQCCPAVGELHHALSQDGWVYQDETDETWNLAHDLLADKTLLDELLKPTTRYRALRQLLADASACGFQESAIRALQRIAADLPETPWLKLFLERPAEWKTYIPTLISSHLFSLAEKLQLLEAYQEDRESLVSDPIISGALGFIARSCWKHAEENAEVDRQVLKAWLDAAVQKDNPFNFTLTHALHLDGERYRQAAWDWLETHPPAIQTHYLLCAWLREKLPAENILGHLQAWLTQFGLTRWATFIFRAWLEDTKDLEAVKPLLAEDGFIKQAIQEWLAIDRNRICPEAQFVYQSWLDATQDETLVQESIAAWLTEGDNAVSPEAQFVYKSWLDATQDGALVKEPIAAWLAEGSNAVSPEASFVYKSWLNATQDETLVKESIKAWLKVLSNAVSLEASYVFPSWLDATQDEMLVKESIAAWLATGNNAVSPEAGFVYQSWLDATQDEMLVKESIAAWLATGNNAVSPEAQFVYKSWLDATKDETLVKESIVIWLATGNNAVSPDARFIYKSWLDATPQDGTLVKESIKAWLAAGDNAISPEGSFVYTSWLDGTQDGALVKDSIQQWLEVPSNAISIDASFVFKSWLKAKGDRTFIQAHVLHWLEQGENALLSGADFIYRAWGDAEKSLPEAMLPYASGWVRYSPLSRPKSHRIKIEAG